MHISSLEKTKKVKMDLEGASNVDKQIPISRTDGTPTFSVRVFTIGPGGHTPHHNHPFEHLNYIIEGRGILVGPDSEQEVKKGDFALVLPGETHQYKNTSADLPLIMICAVPKEYE